ncbi:hypothetical protein [Dactylosporangium sp. CA-139066]|uniref:hypothetical protein n=1 Tax=Dactylosporangium sp. CA-139066 TaxID=3239930 RepID=UPI003D8DAE8F
MTTGAEEIVDLPPGRSATFGSCRCNSCTFDVRVHPAITIAVRIIAEETMWRIGNLHSEVSCTVSNLEAPAEHIAVPSGRMAMPVPFELATVISGGRPALTVFGPEPQLAPATVSCPQVAYEPVLDEGTAYFRALVALCASRMHGGSDARLPSTATIAGMLTRAGVPTTPRGARDHLDHVFGKLALAGTADPDGERSGPWRRELLVRTTLRRGIVRPEHLDLLVPRLARSA